MKVVVPPPPKPETPDSREYYGPNYEYGNAEVLRKYCGWEGPIPAIIPHGVDFEDRVYPGEIIAPVPAVLAWGENRIEPWAQYKHVIPACAPFCYAHELEISTPEREGTLFVPSHSTTMMHTFDHDDWYRMAKSLKDLPAPVTVLMHWQDVDRKAYRPFEKRGYKWFCCGGRLDENFLYRLAHLMKSHRYLASNEVGSHTFYGLYAGLTHLPWVGERPSYQYRGPMTMGGAPAKEQFHWSPVGEERAQRVYDMLASEASPESMSEVVSHYLGVKYLKTPEVLFEDLDFAAKLRQLIERGKTMEEAAECLVKK